MSTWSEYFWGYSSNTPTEPELSGLPEYNTFNGLDPKFQVTTEHDPDHIFPEELDLVEQVRNQVPGAANWPIRYILIFLFARRHSVPHSVNLLTKHINWLKTMGFPEISVDNPYPFTPDQLTPEEREYALFGGHTLYRHGLVDKHNRLLQYIRMRCWFGGRIPMHRYVSTVIWWYYYTWQFIPLSIHRNGMAVAVDMTDMGWANVDISSDVHQFITNALTGFPGRMRQCWIVNPNWALSTAMSFLKLVLSAKVLGRMRPVVQDVLLDEIPRENIPVDLGGDWVPDLKREWYFKVLELDQKEREEREKKKNNV